MKSDIDIVCPNCQQKAAYFADIKTHNYLLKVGSKGKMSCLNCGLNGKLDFKPEHYFYKIPIKERFYSQEILKISLQ